MTSRSSNCGFATAHPMLLNQRWRARNFATIAAALGDKVLTPPSTPFDGPIYTGF